MGKHMRHDGHGPKHKAKKLGAGISIEKFARAKATGYDKKAIQEKERALNAKKVNKYKKLKQRLNDKLQPPAHFAADLDEEGEVQQQQPSQQHASSAAAVAAATPGPSGSPSAAQAQQPPEKGGQPALQGGRPQQQQQQHAEGKAGRKRHKPASQLQRLAADMQAKKEVEQQEHEERARLAAERRAKLEADHQRRAAQSKLFRKKTHAGQPLMKYRIEKVLGQLGAAAS